MSTHVLGLRLRCWRWPWLQRCMSSSLLASASSPPPPYHSQAVGARHAATAGWSPETKETNTFNNSMTADKHRHVKPNDILQQCLSVVPSLPYHTPGSLCSSRCHRWLISCTNAWKILHLFNRNYDAIILHTAASALSPPSPPPYPPYHHTNFPGKTTVQF